MTMTYVWLAAIILFAVAEGVTMGLTSIWFCVGALAGLIAAAGKAGLPVQIAVFLLVSAATMYLVRPLAKKYMAPRQVHTNADRVIGMEGIVIETIDNMAARGLVSIGGATWTARSENGEILKKDTRVQSLRIEGVKLFVRPVERKTPSMDDSVTD